MNEVSIEKARRMLVDEMVKQPNLQIFYTTETYKKRMIPVLVEHGYLTLIGSPAAVEGKEIVAYDITPKIREEMKHERLAALERRVSHPVDRPG